VADSGSGLAAAVTFVGLGLRGGLFGYKLASERFPCNRSISDRSPDVYSASPPPSNTLPLLCVPILSCAFLYSPLRSYTLLCVPILSSAFLYSPLRSYTLLCVPILSSAFPYSASPLPLYSLHGPLPLPSTILCLSTAPPQSSASTMLRVLRLASP
jgi:hypothetical protein